MQCVDLGGRRIIKKTLEGGSCRECGTAWCGRLWFFQAEDGIRDVERSRGLGDVYKRQNEYEVFAKLLVKIIKMLSDS